MNMERVLRRALILVAVSALGIGGLAWGFGRGGLATWIWALGTFPVAVGLMISMTRDFASGRMGVDAIAFLSMTAALALGQTLAGVVVAVMYAGGNVLEDFAVARAESDLKSLVDRAPRLAHRRREREIEEIPIEEVAVGDMVMVRGGDIIPVDGIITSPSAMID
jgi:cation transport ATPase